MKHLPVVAGENGSCTIIWMSLESCVKMSPISILRYNSSPLNSCIMIFSLGDLVRSSSSFSSLLPLSQGILTLQRCNLFASISLKHFWFFPKIIFLSLETVVFLSSVTSKEVSTLLPMIKQKTMTLRCL